MIVGLLASELVDEREKDVGNAFVVEEEAHEWDVDWPCSNARVGVGDVDSDAFDASVWRMAVDGVLELLAEIGASRIPDGCPDGGENWFLRWIIEGSFASAGIVRDETHEG